MEEVTNKQNKADNARQEYEEAYYKTEKKKSDIKSKALDIAESILEKSSNYSTADRAKIIKDISFILK